MLSLPPLPVLSLDASDRLERAFEAAGVPLQVVRGRRDVPARARHSLLKLAGDLPSRSGLVLSRAGVRDLRADPDKRHLLDEARRIVADGAVLLLGCDPAGDDFHAWWAALAPTFQGAGLFAVGEPSAPWPAGVACLGPHLAALGQALAAVGQALAVAQPLPEEAPILAPSHPVLTGTAHTPRAITRTGEARDYDLAAVRDLLLSAFTAEDLRRLFLYTTHPALRPLIQEFSPNDGLAAMVDKTVTFCQTQRLLPDLLREVEDANPRQYAHFAGRLRA